MLKRFAAGLCAILVTACLPALARDWNVDDLRDDLPTADFTRVAQAIAAAADGDTIIVQPGIYYEQLNLSGRRLHLRSSDPSDPDVTDRTIIDGQYLASVITFRGNETAGCIIEGFTLTHGVSEMGGCILGRDESGGSTATIRLNVIRANIAVRSGGALYGCSGTITQNLFEMNVAGADGGALAMCGGEISNNIFDDNEAVRGGALFACPGRIVKNVFRNNSAERGGAAALVIGEFANNTVESNRAKKGGGLADANGSVHDNDIRFNTAEEEGGAFFGSSGQIRNNTIYKNSAPLGGGCSGCSGTWSGNSITGNWAETSGGGLYQFTGTIRGNQIIGNAAGVSGGGAADCSGTIADNIIRFNAAPNGGGLARCTGPVVNNTIQANTAADAGGAMWRCGNQIQSNLIESNSAGQGGALALCFGSVLHNTLAFNSATTAGTILTDGASGIELRNNIFYRNGGIGAIGGVVFNGRYPAQIALNCFYGNPPLSAFPALTAEQINTLNVWCGDNFTADPRFVSAAAADPAIGVEPDNDYHLAAGSPCLDRASWHILGWLPVHDRDGLGRVYNWKPDLGCFERGARVDTDGDGLDDTTEKSFGTKFDRTDSDGDGLSDGLEVARESSPLDKNEGGIVIVPTDWPDAQQAVLFAFDGDLVVLNPGTHYGPLDLKSRSISFRSRQPYLPGYRESTRIDALGQDSAIKMDGLAAQSVMIEGLTIANGKAPYGGAILAGGASLTIRNSVINANVGDEGGTIEGGVGVVESCLFSANRGLMGGCLAHYIGPVRASSFRDNVGGWGGVFYGSESTTITSCIFSGNEAVIYGGIAYECFGEFSENELKDNEAELGGCLFRFNGPIRRNTFRGNSADDGGVFYQCHGIITQNVFESNHSLHGSVGFDCNGEFVDNDFNFNSATLNGGALMNCNAAVRNNRFFANSAYDGGVMVFCDSVVVDNTFTSNTAENSGGVINFCGGALINNTFERNRCGSGSGGVACFYYGDMTGNTFRDNSSRMGGVAVVVEGNLKQNLFENNSAADGGAISYLTGSIDANRFIGNNAQSQGGALSNITGPVTNNIFQSNSAAYGGAIQGCRGTIAFNTIIGNSAAKNGGALYNCPAASIANNIFDTNTRVAIYVGNRATSPTLLVSNCFHSNPDGDLRYFDKVVYSDPALINSKVPNASANIGADPKFTSSQDLRLRPGSPCIDTGHTIAMSPDYNSVPRPLDGNGDGVFAPDIGAYEFFGVRIVSPAKPTTWQAGDIITVEWQSVERWAGSVVRFELWRGGRSVAVLGEGRGACGTIKLRIPLNLYTGSDYRLRGISVSNASMVGENPILFTIKSGKSSARDWLRYH